MEPSVRLTPASCPRKDRRDRRAVECAYRRTPWDSPKSFPKRLGGPITQEADIRVGRSRVSITGRVPGENEGAGALLIVHVEHSEDLDDLFHRIRDSEPSLQAEPPEKQSYGPRTFTVTDPWGYRWSFWHGEADPPNETGNG
jgi:uncharacterized glyoxalase superfamily protein PhnB